MSVGAGLLLAAGAAPGWTSTGWANSRLLAVARAHDANVTAYGEPAWCGPHLNLHMVLGPRSPDLHLPSAQGRLLSQLGPLIQTQCPSALQATAIVTRPGYAPSQFGATAGQGWVFAPVSGAQVAAPARPTFSPPALAMRVYPPVAPLQTLAPPALAPPALAPPALQPQALTGAPGYPPAAAAPPAPAIPAPVAAPAPEDQLALQQPMIDWLARQPEGVRLRAFMEADSGAASPQDQAPLDNARDARARALIGGGPVDVAMLVQAAGDGRQDVATAWPGNLTVSLTGDMAPLKSHGWYLLSGAFDVPAQGDPPVAHLQAQTLFACAQEDCADAADPAAIAHRKLPAPAATPNR